MARRPTIWVDSIINSALAAGLFVEDLTAALPSTEQQTVTRIVGDIGIYPDVLTANIANAQAIDIGIGVASQAAFDVPAAGGLPDPRLVLEAPARDWLWVTRLVIVKDRPAGETFTLIVPEVHLDLRAARKIDKGVLFLIAVKTAVIGSANDVLLQGRLRCLIQT